MLISAQIADECVMLQARHAQEPITSAGKSLIRGVCKMLEAVKQLAINQKDVVQDLLQMLEESVS
jgi:hypothetical protein